MVKYILVLISFFILFKVLNYKLIQFYYQRLIFFITFKFLIELPFNGLNFWYKIYYVLGCDYNSMGLILLRYWIFSLIIISRLRGFKYKYFYYFCIINFILLFLIACFISINIILFYLFFESRLIPIFLLIIGWGYQVDRVQAGFYIILYTLIGSLPLFFFIIFLDTNEFTLTFNIVNFKDTRIYMYALIMTAFLIKIPIYLVHLWLPKAHVEAPLVGSIVLAGVILKLGSYGLMRFILIIINICLKFNKFLIVVRLMGGIYSRLICLCQIDMKMLVAYSSVVHIRVLMGGMITLFNWGYFGGLLIIIAHGLCSSGLFYLVNLNYERLGSRRLLINKGLINYFPSLSLLWFLLCSSNLSFPPSLNLFSEIILLNSLIMWRKLLVYLLILILFFRASYSLYLYSFSQHGIFNGLVISIKGVTVIDFIILIRHWVPLNLIFLIIYLYL